MPHNAPCKMLKNGVGKKSKKYGCLKQRWQRLWGLWAGYIGLSPVYSSMSSLPPLPSQTDAQTGEQ